MGTRLLPEFDVLLLGYAPSTRERFATRARLAVLWQSANGLLLTPVLHQGRLVGYWRLTGSGRRRQLAVSWFPGSLHPVEAGLVGPVADLQAAIVGQITDVRLTPHRD